MKQKKECLGTQNNRISTVIRRYFSASFSTLLQTSAVTSLIVMPVAIFVLILTGATNLFGLNGSANATTSTITLSITSGLSVDVMPSDNGTFASSTATNNVRVRTDSASGYELGIKASTSGSNNNALINTSDSSKIIPSITSSISEATYSSSSTYNNTWGFKPSKLNSQANSNYIPGPTDTINSIVLDRTTTANPTTFNDYTITLGTRIDNTQAPGSYANTFVITALANPTPYSITYNKNTTDTVTNMPANVSSETYSDQVTISNLVPARDGYNFKGWCTVQVADGGTCSGTTYNPDGGGTALTWTLDQTTSSNSLTIYAMWESATMTLYDTVASMVKKTNGNPRTQTLADMQAVITKPTSNDPATDTSNSGVYKYDASLFGTASDNNSACTRSDGCPIYYYRGILDSDLTDDSSTSAGYVGSSGDGAYYPNYVVLSSASNKGSLTTSNTCWRIVRTTGSGGIKMIYNGKWTGSTCANAGSSANAVSSVYFNRRSSSSTNNYDTKGRIIYVGYNYSSTSSHQTGTSAVSNSTLFVNNTASNLRTQLESWYASNMTSYTSKLETNAGWCNDRTTYNSSYTSQSSTVPYATSSAKVYFGAYKRNMRSGASEKLSLTCTNAADRLTTSNGMTYPAAPLTADEVALAGSGYSGRTSTATTSSNYHYNSYLRSGDNFWLLSPLYRASSGNVYGFILLSNGFLGSNYVSNPGGVRPSISLKPGSMAVGGSGTATDPWIVDTSVSPNPYCTDASTCMQNTTNPPACGTTMVDGRDGATYTTATIAGTCWMTKNLRFTGSELKVGESDVTSDITMTYGQLTSGNSYTEPRIATGSTTDYGTYYNFCAASAGEVCDDVTAQDATRSVCPAGWKLPTQAQLNALPQKESHFIASSGLAGYYDGGSLEYAGAYGSWWASTAVSATLQSRLYYYSDFDFWDVLGNSKYLGGSARCVRAS